MHSLDLRPHAKGHGMYWSALAKIARVLQPPGEVCRKLLPSSCHSPSGFCWSCTGEVDEDMMGAITFASFKSLKVEPIFAISPGVAFDGLSWLRQLREWMVSVLFTCFFLPISLTPQARVLIGGFF